ncbi:hypothetical protein HYW87_05145 [Candidatus Roizmanbacteria bacterium]|nr:hypothetical protein [Candidatus Roizmanbacteria bacterium]
MNTLPIVKRGVMKGMRFERDKSISAAVFLYGFFSFIVIFFLVIMLRLFQLTIVRGDYYKRISEQNRIREFIIEPKRGEIVDRKGFVIVKNDSPDTQQNESRLTSHRTYQDPETIAHLIGYRQKADKADFANDLCLYKLQSRDKVGKKGIEKLFECTLRGRHGKKLIEVDAKGNSIKTLSLLPPEDGKRVTLAFDSDLQKKAYELIKDKKAAVVGLKPTTGEVLVFVSSPSFNPQDFEDANESVTRQIINGENKPLFNRASEGVYPPGSIFKPVVATAALEEKKITVDTLVEDTGQIKAGPITFGNWYFLQYGKTEGMIDVVKAIRRSNDIFFYKTGALVTTAKIKTWAEKFGFAQKTNIGFEEAEGLVPSEFWKEEVLKDQWYLGDTYNLAIGQGFISVTPLQVAQATAVFANGGYLCSPQLLKLTT